MPYYIIWHIIFAVCKTRKEKACLEAPDKCIWKNDKCHNIDSDTLASLAFFLFIHSHRYKQ